MIRWVLGAFALLGLWSIVSGARAARGAADIEQLVTGALGMWAGCVVLLVTGVAGLIAALL
jgi:hypothetical protein